MNKPKGVLWMVNDSVTPSSKTTEYLAEACRRIDIPCLIRDSSDARFLKLIFERLPEAHRLPEVAKEIGQKFIQLVEDFEIDCVMSLDLHWFFMTDLFISQPEIARIVSIWFDDFWSWCTCGYNQFFSSDDRPFQEIVKHPKVLHCFYGQSQAQEAKLLGFSNQLITRLAAPREYLEYDFPCLETKKAVFIGNPGFRGSPTKKAIKRLNEGAELEELRRISRDQILNAPPKKMLYWIGREPTVFPFMQMVTEVKVQLPYEPTLQIIKMAENHYPRAFLFLNEIGSILDVAHIVKLVNRYDRPAVISRLFQRGLVDVYSGIGEWEPYGIKAKSHVNFDEIPRYYQMYSCHLNGANCIRDATANEKLFEIAACGRTSINLESPDVKSCYNNEEIGMANSLNELEELAVGLLADPDKALEMGRKARARTEREHLWDHRLATILNQKASEEKT